MKTIYEKIYQNSSLAIGMLTGAFIGHLASKYSYWILLLLIPYFYQMFFAIAFKNINK